MPHRNYQRCISRGLALGAIVVAATVSSVAVSAGELTIYSTTDGDNLKVIGKAFAKAHPDIKVNWVRDSTGIMHSRIMAEKDNPRHDVLFGMAATSMLTMDELGMFIPYTPKGVDKLDARYRDKRNPAHWTGIYGWAGAICFNTIEAKKNKLPKPTKWADLTNPVYKGHITMPNPASSGTGFLDVSSWMQIWDEKRAWAYMDKLHQNIASYTHSGSTPCKQAASGEYTVGVSWPFRGAKLKSKGAPIDIIVPEEGIGWEMQAIAIMKGTKNMKDAKTFIDWAVTEPAMKIYANRYSVVAMPVAIKKWDNFPPEVQTKMIDNDFIWAANNKARIVAEWRKRYDGKTEPRKKK
ncbi:MAG: putative 2-aminoethylphosphonate ABC transporter substrate-binding protein [Hyphomicrobiaceae bacterium]